MLASSPEFDTQVEGRTQTVAMQVRVDLPGLADDVTLVVESVEPQESTTTDQPDGTRYPVGFPAMALDVTLSGDVTLDDGTVLSVAQVFSPYCTVSPLYRMDPRYRTVELDLGVVVPGGVSELLPCFRGMVDDVEVSPSDGTVTLSCIDRRSELRSAVDMPAVVTADPYNAGLTAEYAIDALLRSATEGAISSWPATRGESLLAAGMRASAWAETGTLRTGKAQLAGVTVPFTGPRFVPGKFGSALSGNATAADTVVLQYEPARPIAQADEYINFEMWAGPSTATSITLSDTIDASGYVVSVNLEAGQVRVLLFVPTGTGYLDQYTTPFALPPAGGQYIGVSVRYPSSGTSWYVTVRIGGTTWTTGARSIGVARPVTTLNYAAVAIPNDDDSTLEALQVWTGGPVAAWNDTFTPQAVLDPSLNPLTVIPAVTGDPWQTIQQIASAELGVAGFGNDGIFRFVNRDTIRTGPTVRTITADDALEQFDITIDGASYANRVQVPFTEWNFGDRATIWEQTTALQVPPNSTVELWPTLDQLACAIDRTVAFLPDSGVIDGNSYFRASVDRYGTTQHNGVTVAVQRVAADKLHITITNSAAGPAWLVSSAEHVDLPVGTPVLRIGGVPVTPQEQQGVDVQWPPVLEDGTGGAASTRTGEIVHAVSANPWVQSRPVALGLANSVLSAVAFTRPALSNVTIRPDRRLQLTDRIRLQEPDRTGIDEYAVIFGQRFRLAVSDDGALEYTHGLDARAVTFPGGWILGVPGRTELGATTNI